MVFDWLSSSVILPELHVALGAAVTLGAYLLLRGIPPYSVDWNPKHHWNRIAIGVFLVVIFLKELLWDPVNEKDNPFLWQGLIDFGWYVVGVAVALGLIYARFREL